MNFYALQLKSYSSDFTQMEMSFRIMYVVTTVFSTVSNVKFIYFKKYAQFPIVHTLTIDKIMESLISRSSLIRRYNGKGFFFNPGKQKCRTSIFHTTYFRT